jgi:hypothetical protein
LRPNAAWLWRTPSPSDCAVLRGGVIAERSTAVPVASLRRPRRLTLMRHPSGPCPASMASTSHPLVRPEGRKNAAPACHWREGLVRKFVCNNAL